jgi:regulatory protein
MTGSAAPQRPERRPPGPVTEAYLRRAALHYLERYAATAEGLRRLLARKAERRARIRAEAAPDPGLIEAVVTRLAEQGLLDDRRFAEGRAASLRQRGVSARAIRARLQLKGVPSDIADEALSGEAGSPEAERAAAEAYARRRRIGPYRARERALHRERNLAAMARAGFPFAVARAVIDAEEA